MDDINELLTRGVANVIPGKKELEEKLKSGAKLNIYFGIDPTSTKIHLGHAVAIRKLQSFAQKGHNVTFLIGDFTALIGDTSDKDSERPALSPEEIEENFKDYKKQAEKILDFSKINVRYNSEWLKSLSFEDIVKLCQHFSVGDFVGRELIKKRLADKKRVGLHEFLYPVMQGYDSYFMDTDLQIGGTDQTFNMQAGRALIKDLRNKDSFVLSTPILEGADGRKMSKSWGNAIWLEDNPVNMFVKVMAVQDEFIINYFNLATNLPLEQITEIEKRLKAGENPIQIKKLLARQIVIELHDETLSEEAQKEFERMVQNKELPNELKLFAFDLPELSIIEILTHSKLASSNSEAKRLVEQGGVSIDEETIKNPNEKIKLDTEKVLKVGKRNYLKIISK